MHTPITTAPRPAADDHAKLELPSRNMGDKAISALINVLIKLGILKKDLDYHLVRASMVILFLFFGYQKWWDYEAQTLIPFISNGPLISWMYPVFGIRGASWFETRPHSSIGSLPPAEYAAKLLMGSAA